jgi:hypothetical protein
VLIRTDQINRFLVNNIFFSQKQKSVVYVPTLTLKPVTKATTQKINAIFIFPI